MKFLKNLFQPKWQHQDDNVRRAGIEALANNADELIIIAKEDSNAVLRHLALDKIDSLTRIIELRADSRLGNAMTDKLIAKLNDKTVELSALASIGNEQIMALVFASQRLDLQQELLANINDEQTLFELVKASTSGKVRAAAAERIHSQATLEQLVDFLKGKDKNSWRASKARLDDIVDRQKAEQEKADTAQRLLDGAEKLISANIDPNYSVKLKGYIEQWSTLDSQTTSPLQSAFDSATAQAQGRLDAIKAEHDAKQASLETEQFAAKLSKELPQALQNLIIDGLNNQQFDPELQIDVLNTQWGQLIDLAGEPTTLALWKAWSDRYLHIHNWFVKLQEQGLTVAQLTAEDHQELIDELHQAANWPTDVAKPALLAQFAPQGQQATKVSAPAKPQQDDAQYQLAGVCFGLVKRIHRQIEQGEFRRAFGTLKALEEKSQNLEKAPMKLQRDIEIVQDELAKYQDWQHYATLPKKQELVSKMQALAEKELEPEAKVQLIKNLQNEWKEVSKGSKDLEPELWQAFQTAGDTAFEACKPWLNAQAAQREQTLARRLALIAELQQYDATHNWQSPDWNQVKKVLKLARDEWRTLEPVERQAHQQSLAQFDAAVNVLQDKINSENSQRAAQKQALVEKAAALLELDNAKNATEEAKKLQQQWKEIGFGDRKSEDQLWQSFRQSCDALFAKREGERDAFVAQLNENQTAADDVLTTLEQVIAHNSDNDISERVSELSQQFEQIGALPKSSKEATFKRFKAARTAYQEQLKQDEINAAQEQWQALLDWNSAMQQAEAGNATQPSELPDSPIAKSHLEIRLQQTSGDERKLRELCIQLEILLDKATPNEDTALRMELQVERLKQGLGTESQNNTLQQTRDLLCQWFEQSSKGVANYSKLFDRFWQTSSNVLR